MLCASHMLNMKPACHKVVFPHTPSLNLGGSVDFSLASSRESIPTFLNEEKLFFLKINNAPFTFTCHLYLKHTE